MEPHDTPIVYAIFESNKCSHYKSLNISVIFAVICTIEFTHRCTIEPAIDGSNLGAYFATILSTFKLPNFCSNMDPHVTALKRSKYVTFLNTIKISVINSIYFAINVAY